MKMIEQWNDDKTGFRWYRMEGHDFPFISVTSVLDHIVPRKLKNYFIEKAKGVETKEKATGKKSAAMIGTELHLHIENLCNGKPDRVPEEYQKLVSAVGTWKDKHEILVKDTELIVANPKLGYAGTLDMAWKYTGPEIYFEDGEKKVRQVEDELRIVDIKTGFVSTKHGWQLAAYRLAYEMEVDENVGMSVLQCSYKNNSVELFAYTHLDFCTNMFLSAIDTWKGLYYNQLKYPVVSPTGVEMQPFPYLNENSFCRHYGDMTFEEVNYLLRRGK